jgi:formate dehydrogenase iron-sulfur subunit
LGAYLPPSLFDTVIDYEALFAIGAGVGHGGVVVFNDSVDLMQQARYAFQFCAEESCGKCTPCRIGAVRGVEVMDRLRNGEDPVKNMGVLKDLCELMVDGSLCAMGGMTPIPVESALKHFPEDFAFPSKRRTFGSGSETPS